MTDADVAGRSPARVGRGAGAGEPAEGDQFEQRVAHHPVPPVQPAGDLAGANRPGMQVCVGADLDATVLVVQGRTDQERLLRWVETARRARCAA